MSIKLFPHILIRVGGGSFARLQRLDLTKSIHLVHEIVQLRAGFEILKQKLCDDLFVLIQSQNENPVLQKSLLNFKRDIFNERKISSDKYSPVLDTLGADLRNQFNLYEEQKAHIGKLIIRGESAYDDEVLLARKQLSDLATDANLQKGLLLSSQSLLQGVEEYIKHDVLQPTKKEYKTEEGLIKYLSRMYAKTSPFSTFTHLVMAGLACSENRNTGLIHLEKNAELKVVSHIRLNNFLYQYVRALLTKNQDIRRYFLLRPNPTVHKHEDHYRFLTNSNNVEAFQRIPGNPVVEVFFVLCSEHKEGVRYGDLISTIIQNEYIDASKEDIGLFIDQLIDYGFLEYNIGVSGIDPDWDLKLCAQLKPMAGELPMIQDLLGILMKMREMMTKYAIAGLPERKSFLRDAHSEFRSVCMKLHEAAGLPEEERLPPEEFQKFQLQKRKELEKEKKLKKEDGEDDAPHKDTSDDSDDRTDETFKHRDSTYFYFRPEQMFYEDTTLDIAPELDSNRLSACITSLHRLLDQMWLFEGRSDECDSMIHYFEQKYGSVATIDLLTFYEDYFREYRKPEAQRRDKIRKEQLKKMNKDKNEEPSVPAESPEPAVIAEPDEKKNESNIPKIRERQELRKEWQESFASKFKPDSDLPGSDTIHVNLEKVEENNRTIDDVSKCGRQMTSCGAFIQFCEDKDNDGNNKLVGVLNASFPGFGKMISRFLHIFDQASTADIRRFNIDQSRQEMFVEDCDASYFNANLHPPLMPFEIWMPNGHNSLPPENQIPVTDLEVSLDSGTGQLRLIHKPTQKTAYMFDLGFQGHGGRSQLFQLLEKFTRSQYLSAYPIAMSINSVYEPKDKDADGKTLPKMVYVRPRIVYDDWLILQRKAWFVPKELLPLMQPKESDWSYFERINEWRLSYHIPEEVFMFVLGKGNDNIKPEEGKKVGRDDRKPQYISFKNPFLVSLFASLVNKVPGALRIEEMLPNSQQLNTLCNEKYVTEFVVQWYTSASAS